MQISARNCGFACWFRLSNVNLDADFSKLLHFLHFFINFDKENRHPHTLHEFADFRADFSTGMLFKTLQNAKFQIILQSLNLQNHKKFRTSLIWPGIKRHAVHVQMLQIIYKKVFQIFTRTASVLLLSPTVADPCLTASMAYSTWWSRPSGDQVVTSLSYWLRNWKQFSFFVL